MKLLFKLILISTTLISSAFLHAYDSEENIKLEQVPEKVMEAAKSELRGFKPVSAVKETSKKDTEYEITGTANGKTYEVEVKVNKAGTIIEIEVEVEEDDDDEDNEKEESD